MLPDEFPSGESGTIKLYWLVTLKWFVFVTFICAVAVFIWITWMTNHATEHYSDWCWQIWQIVPCTVNSVRVAWFVDLIFVYWCLHQHASCKQHFVHNCEPDVYRGFCDFCFRLWVLWAVKCQESAKPVKVWSTTEVVGNNCFSRYVYMLCVTGKVHGSLARAGKVRGQTPKVNNHNYYNRKFLQRF